MGMKVKEVAELIGVSIQTLHHYDQIGLLTPQETTDSGYRLYSEENLEQLQQILFFKELDFSLKEIKEIINSPSFNRREALLLQKKMLIEKRNRVDKMIETIDKSIKHIKGEISMTNKERFEGIHFKHNLYEQEARKRWGDQPVDKVNIRLKNMTDGEQKDLSDKWTAMFNTFALLINQSPKSPDVQTAIKEWFDFLNENFGEYSFDAFYGLGQLYIEDKRFTKNIDQYGEGLAKLMSDAITIYIDHQKRVVPIKIIIEDTIGQYETLFSMIENREDYYRYSMMKPFEDMWKKMNVPLKAKQPNGYDVIMAANMLGYLSIFDTETGRKALENLKEIQALQIAYGTLTHCVEFIKQNRLKINADEIRFGMYLANQKKLELHRGYCGFGGIPGFIQVSIFPNSYNIPRLPAVIAHEFHHNIRFSYFNWDYGNVTVGDYLIIEGLAESFAKELYGEALLGPWVTSFEKEDLEYSKEIIKDSLNVKGFAEVSSYMFGDTFAAEQGYQPVGLSPFAGYAVGYQAVQSFMKTNNVGISEATLLGTDEILSNSGLFL
ncbi:Mercuric resistance operon regulatory protein [Bacillus velezensis]|nr:Mercuric resistance operon regulatory protein [Bacillus velezensis]